MIDTILFLTNNENTYPLVEWLKSQCTVVVWSERVTINEIKKYSPQIVVSFNYRYIVSEDVIEAMNENIINLHISYLPWNKGANPNFWSFIDDTPKGVTIHKLTAKLDQGDILFQKEMLFDVAKETFTSSYQKLIDGIIELFKEKWNTILNNTYGATKQIGEGSYHSMKDFKAIKEKIDFSWDDKIGTVIEKYKGIPK